MKNGEGAKRTLSWPCEKWTSHCKWDQLPKRLKIYFTEYICVAITLSLIKKFSIL